MKIYNSVEQLIGNTPLVKLNRMDGADKATVLVKLESRNPAGSAKDRAALEMVNDAERRGVLKPGGTIVEPTSGNTGIGLSLIAALRGYRLVITMPDSMSRERILLMRHFGAEVVLTPGALGMKGAIAKAKEIREAEHAFMADQFGNPANPEAHYRTTGPEIWRDTEGKVDIFLASVGTGGTFSGTAKYLKEQSPSVKVYAVEPEKSPVLSGGKPAPHGIQGIGGGFVPGNYNGTLADGILTVSDEEAFATARLLTEKEGILCGISSGCSAAAALRLARLPENVGKTIVTVLCDTGERYISTALFGEKA